MKLISTTLKKDPSYFFFILFVFLSFISTLAGQIALVLSLVFTLACKDSRSRFRITWPTWGWIAYLVLAVVATGIMLAVNTDELLNPKRGFSKIFEHLLWYIAIPVVSAQVSSRERFEKTVKTVAVGGLVMALIILVRNPLLAWFRYSYPNPGEIAVLQSGGLDVTDNRKAVQRIIVRKPFETGGIIGADASGVPAGKTAVFLHDMISKAGLEKKATSWVFGVKPRRKVVDKDGVPKRLRQGHANWDWYCWNIDGTRAGSRYLSKSDLYFDVHHDRDEFSVKGGNRPETFIVTLEALGLHGEAQQLLVAFLAALFVIGAGWNRFSAKKRIIAVLVPVLIIFGIIVLFKEGALLVSLLFLFLFFISHFWRSWWKLALSIVFLLMTMVAVVSLPGVSSRLKSSGDSLIMREYNKGGRLMMWMDVVPAVHSEHPFGTGFKGITSSKMRSVNFFVEPREHVHNVFLQAFLDFGYAGVVVFAFWMLVSLRSGISLMHVAHDSLDPCGSAECGARSADLMFPFAALCAMLAVGVIEYNLANSDSVLMYSLAMGLVCPWFTHDVV